jgi:hypothetical protein
MAQDAANVEQRDAMAKHFGRCGMAKDVGTIGCSGYTCASHVSSDNLGHSGVQ